MAVFRLAKRDLVALTALMLRRTVFFSFSLIMSLELSAQTKVVPPVSKQDVVVDDMHGEKIEDPYRWLEGSDAPEITAPDEALDERVGEWTDAQNAYTRARLDNLPGRKVLVDRLREIFEVDDIGAPRRRGDSYFNAERRGKQSQPVLYVRDGLDAESRALLDVNTLDAKGLTALAWYSPSQDGTLVAFGTYLAGDENATLNILETKTGHWLADEIPGKVGGVQWLPDGSGFLYRRLADLDNPYSGQIKFHKVGRHHSQDGLIFEQYKEGPLATTWGPSASTNDEARWLALSYATSTKANDLWVYDFKQWRETGQLKKVDILKGYDASADATFIGDRLYMSTTLDAPRGRIFQVDLNNPARGKWREIIPEHKTAVIRSFGQAGEFLVVNYLENARTRMALFDHGGNAKGDFPLPGIGTAGVGLRENSTEGFLSYQSYNEPPSIYQVDFKTGTRKLWSKPDISVDSSITDVKQVFYPTKDGTEIPMFIVSKKGVKLDGSNPTILYGYGGFNIPLTPRFRSSVFPWLEAGGVYAVANLRGGGEFGDAWHRAGMLESKQNVFDDFIAGAEWLIEKGYTSKEKLAVAGGSNGGLLTGAMLTQRPDLFRAVYCAVPLLDMLRYQHFLMARYWVPEYGSAEDPGQYAFLRKYSPYHNVKKSAYPAVFFTAGENDTRVHALHARKMAARVQAMTTSDPAERPVLLWVEREAGHGGGMPLEMRIERTADQYIFLANQLGLNFE